MGTRRRKSRAIVLALLMITSVLAVVPGATAENPSPLPSDQVFDATGDGQVSVWERGIFPLRTDGRDTVSSITPPDVEAEGLSGDRQDLVFTRGQLTRNPVGFYAQGEPIDVDFKAGRANTGDLDDQDRIQIIAARFDESGDSTVPSTFSEALDLLTLDNANQNATFRMLDANASLDGSGDIDFDYTPQKAGHHVLYLAINESDKAGYEVTNGDISLTGNSTVIGATALTVQRAPASVTPPSTVNPGDTATFDVDASNAFASSADVTHMVALYKRDTFNGSTHRIIVDESEVDSDFNISQDSDLETSIGRTVGVADIEQGITLNGESLSNGRVSRGVGPAAMVDFIAEDLSTNAPDVTRISPDSTLNASITATAGDSPDTTIDVDTFSNFSTGTYQWVYIAKLDNNDSAVTSATGTLSVSTDTGGGPSPPQGGGGDDDEPAQPPAQPPRAPQATAIGNAEVSATATNGQLSVNIQNANSGDQVTIQRNDQEVQEQVEQDGAALEEIQTSFTGQTDFDMQISTSPDKPDPSVPDPPSGDDTVGYLNVEHTASDDAVGEVQFTFRVSQERLDDRGISRDNVVLYHFDDNTGEWSALQTEFVGEAPDGTPRFRGVSNTLSVFAIGSQQAQMTEAATPTPEPTPEPTATPEATDTEAPVQEPGGFGPLTIGLIVVIVLAAIGGLLYYRREQL